MDKVFKKLNYKDQPTVFVFDHPESFEAHLASLEGEAEIRRSVRRGDGIGFSIAFVTRKVEIEHWIAMVAPMLEADAVVWLCYPKGTSKKYVCDFNRDSGFDAMGEYGLEAVRIVAIDDDWSALRFRKVDCIKTMKRKSMALSKEGKRRIRGN